MLELKFFFFDSSLVFMRGFMARVYESMIVRMIEMASLGKIAEKEFSARK